MSDRVNRYISILYRYGQRYLGIHLRPLDLHVGSLPAFMQACRNPGITQEGISANTGMDKGTTARSVKRLEKHGQIIRTDDPADRRVNHIFPTQKALELYPKVDGVLIDLHSLLYQGFTAQEVETALSLLRRMKDNLQNHL